MATSSKPSHDFFGLGLGLLSWIFPNVSIGVKIAVTVVIIGLILFLRMSKATRDQTLKTAAIVSETALTKFIVPSIAGGFRGFFISLIGVFLVDTILDIRLVHQDRDQSVGLPSQSGGGIVKLFLHTLGNLNDAGSVIVVIAVIIGAIWKIEDAAAKRKEIILNSLGTDYTFATYQGYSRFLWIVSLKFEFSYNGKTYRHKEYNSKKRIAPGKTMYQIIFSLYNPKIAKIVWPSPAVTTPTPSREDATKK
ncbi:MAG: hypothetical protein ACHQFX_17060 [Chitinophagales bacterium]